MKFYNTIVIGDLTVKKLMQQPKNKYSKVSKSFGKTNIAMFINYLAYKCQANNVNLIKISEANTTQLNCLTGKLFKDKAGLDDRVVNLGNNVLIDRDLNSAINILKRWEQKHLATVNRPLEINSDVLSSIIEKGSCIL